MNRLAIEIAVEQVVTGCLGNNAVLASQHITPAHSITPQESLTIVVKAEVTGGMAGEVLADVAVSVTVHNAFIEGVAVAELGSIMQAIDQVITAPNTQGVSALSQFSTLFFEQLERSSEQRFDSEETTNARMFRAIAKLRV